MLADLRDFKFTELQEIMTSMGESRFRAEQIFLALHRDGMQDFKNITTLKQATRDYLTSNYSLYNLEIKSVQVSSDNTRKYKFITHDNHIIESVFIPHAAKQGRHSLCISSQVGCAMGCTFCATAKIQLKRNLTPSEIINQVYLVSQDIRSNGDAQELELHPNERVVHNLVYMGMGEPLHNCENVITSIKLLCAPKGMNFSPRRITVSTSGLVPKIKKLGEETDVYLAISLNATTNIIRNQIMPVNKKYNLESLIHAAKNFPLKIRERITFEYVLLAGINDYQEDAKRLVELVLGLKCKVNLIPFNEHPLSPYKKPEAQKIREFHKILYKAGISVFTRKTRGDDIDAACGMLGAEKLEAERAQVC